MELIRLEVTEENVSKRLDVFISEEVEDLTRSNCQRIIEQGNVQVNETTKKANYKLKLNDVVCVEIEDAKEIDVEPENIPLDIVYEDDYLIVVNKPQGMVVHPAPGNYTGTLVNALLYHCRGQLSGINGVIRPGIVHRIDKDTSGTLVVAKNNEAHLSLAEQIKEHSVNRYYIALLHGVIKEDEGTINAPIGRHKVDRKKMAIVQGGRTAITHFTVLERFKNYTLIRAKLETGRTHQIRVHMSSIGHAVVGDPVYGPKMTGIKTKLNGQLLHAQLLGFIHPKTKQYVEFSADLPEYFSKVLDILRNTNKV